MPDPLPPPLVPATIDLRGFQFMALDVARLRDSELASLPDAEAFRVNVLSWCVAWHQVPAASLPADDATLARLLGFGRDVRGWRKVREAGGLRGWILCEDGRLYHPVVADKAMEAWGHKQASKRKRDNDAERLRRWRESRGETHSETAGETRVVAERPDHIISDRIISDHTGSSTPPPPSAHAHAITATGDDGAKAVPRGEGERKADPLRHQEAIDNLTRTEKPLGRRAQGMNATALRLAINSGDALAMVQVFGCPVDGELAVEWRRDTDGMQIGEIAAVLAWRKALKDPVRLPSGFRLAFGTWRELLKSTRQHLAHAHLTPFGITVEITGNVEVAT